MILTHAIAKYIQGSENYPIPKGKLFFDPFIFIFIKQIPFALK